jgi:hypothetical protein
MLNLLTSAKPLWFNNNDKRHGSVVGVLFNPLKYEAQTALFKDPVRTAQ